VVIYDNNVREHIVNKIIITEGTNINTEFLGKTTRTQKRWVSLQVTFFINSKQTAPKHINTSDNSTYVILIKRNRK
jgi:hypothetical protein